MVFASPVFLFFFLPLTLAAYFAAPKRWRNHVLLTASLAFYCWGEAAYVFLIAGSIVFNYALGQRIAGAPGPQQRKRWLAVAVAGNLGALALFKYAPTGMALPLGISFFTFHALSYIADVYRRDAPARPRFSDFALYILAFPQLVAGPIVRWHDIASQIAARTERLEDFTRGARRFVIGLAKKVLLANPLGEAADRVFGLPAAELGTGVAWLGLACYTLQIYFDFSGYSDMAIGMMRMFGFRLRENFRYPYIAASVREFWRRWHISLSTWFRDYLYIPLGGSRRGTLRAWRNLAIVFLLCGLWHGASWTFVLWGAWHGVFLCLERAGLGRLLERTRGLAHAYALLAIMLGWVLFRSGSLSHAGQFYGALFGAGASAAAAYPVMRLLDAYLLTTLAIGIAGCLPLAPMARLLHVRLLGSAPRVAALAGGVQVALLASLALLAAAWLAARTYNPFIYFRF